MCLSLSLSTYFFSHSGVVLKHFFSSPAPSTPQLIPKPSVNLLLPFFLHGEEQENYAPKDGASALGPHLQLKAQGGVSACLSPQSKAERSPSAFEASRE